MSELEEGEIRDDDNAQPAMDPVQATITEPAAAAVAKASQPGKVAKAKSKPSKPSPTEISQGWEFVDTPPVGPAGLNVSELEEGEIVDQSIIEELQMSSASGRPSSSKVEGMCGFVPFGGGGLISI